MYESVPDPVEISRAGREVLIEYLEGERQKVLQEARRLNDNGPLSSFDVVNAIELLRAKDGLDLRAREHSRISDRSVSESIGSRQSTLLLLLVSIITLLPFALFFLTREGDSGSSGMSYYLVALLFPALSIGVVTVMLGILRRRRVLTSELSFRLAESRLAAGKEEALNVLVGSERPWAAHRRESADFLSSWLDFEDILRQSGAIDIPAVDLRRYPIGGLLRGLHARGTLDDEMYSMTLDLLRLRSRLVHGESVGVHELDEGAARLRLLRRQLGVSK